MADNITPLPMVGTTAGSNTEESGGGGTPTPPSTGQVWPRGNNT